MKYSRLILLAVLCVYGAGLAGVAQQQIVVTGVAPFAYDRHVFVPLADTCHHLGASFTWDPAGEDAAIVYHNRGFTVAVGTRTGYYNDQPVLLDEPPVVLHDTLFCPASAFQQYLGVDFRWDHRHHRAYFPTPAGEAYYAVNPVAPPYVLGTFESYGYVPADYTPVAPAPFVQAGVEYLPLRTVADYIGAAILFDLATDRGVVTYADTQTVLYIGDNAGYYDDQAVYFPAAPVLCDNVVYVPETLVANYWHVPFHHHRGYLEFAGDEGRWHGYNVRPDPPAPVQRTLLASPVYRRGADGLRASASPGHPTRGLSSRAERLLPPADRR